MIEDQFKTSPDLEKAKKKEQEAKEKRDKALKALGTQKRKFENGRKYFIGGTIKITVIRETRAQEEAK